MNPRPNPWRTWLLLTLPGLLWLTLLHRLQGYPGGPLREWLRDGAVAMVLGLVATGLAVPVGQRLSAHRRSGAAMLVTWALTLAVAVSGAVTAAGPVSVALFGGHPGHVARDGVAAFLFLFPLALLIVGAQRVHLIRASAAYRRVGR